MKKTFAFLFFAVALICGACGSDSSTPQDGAVDQGGTVDQDGAVQDAQVLDLSQIDSAPSSDGSSVDSCTSSTEVCDGKDNDCNALVDDVDADSDGVFDCYRIALLGQKDTGWPVTKMEAWLTDNAVSYERIHDSGDDELTATVLAAYDMVIVDNLIRNYSENEATALADWVTAGGRLLIIGGNTGDGPDLTMTNSLIAKIGLECLDGKLDGPITSFTSHAVGSGIGELTFYGGYALGEVEGVTGGSNEVFAKFDDEKTAGLAQVRSAGKVVFWGDEWVKADGEWDKAENMKFWTNLMQWFQAL